MKKSDEIILLNRKLGEKINELEKQLLEEKLNYEKLSREYAQVEKEKSDLIKKYNEASDYRYKVRDVEDKNSNLESMNELLTQAVLNKFYRGCAILYDEHDPRIIKVVKDGKEIDVKNASSVYFHWDLNEFPSIEITN